MQEALAVAVVETLDESPEVFKAETVCHGDDWSVVAHLTREACVPDLRKRITLVFGVVVQNPKPRMVVVL
jgi:hypothetical protein